MTPFKPFVALFALLCAVHLPSAMAAKSLVVEVFAHDELADISNESLEKDYFSHWIKEMREISAHPVEIVFRRGIAGVTDIDYRNKPPQQTLETFGDNASQQAKTDGKLILITKDIFDSNTAGLASVFFGSGTYAMASMSAYGNAAHELGHLLSAVHEDSEIRFNGWACETYMQPGRNQLRSNCYRYSDANRERIAQNLQRTLE
ncbi:hypothetical protein [Pseudomonas sp. NUPR-001]|uniref:hypothetical protein n=1 Tax=Pseudomonas sp. NUPR-001 TaxID=3416058 RepID=UPI003F994625